MRVSVRSGAGVTPAQVKRWYIYAGWEARQRVQGSVEVTSASVHPETKQIYSLHIEFDDGGRWKHHFILRTPTVDVLTSVKSGGEEVFLFVEQFRPAIGQLVISNPAGGIDENEYPDKAALREVREEVGMPNLNPRLSLLEPESVLATPGAVNEEVYMYRGVVQVTSSELVTIREKFHGGTTGVAEEGEVLKGYAISRNDLPRFKRRIIDAKTRYSLRLAGL